MSDTQDVTQKARFFVQRCIYHGGSLPCELPEDLTPRDIVLCPGCEDEANANS